MSNSSLESTLALTRQELKAKERKSLRRRIKLNWELYVIISIPIIWLLIFAYYPMYGVQIAFRKFTATKGILGSPWVGMDNFVKFFNSYNFARIIRNTLAISVYDLVVGFPFPIILAILLNNSLKERFKKFVQIVTYMPYFISTVVMVGIIIQFLSPKVGVVNYAIQALGGTEIDFMGRPEYFRNIYVWSNIWQGTGWSAIIYLSALSSIDPGLHEAALVDGANRFQRMWHIDLPGILPTIAIMLTLRAGSIMSVGFEKAFLMQNNLNISTSEIISTYIYKTGLASAAPDYSYSAAIGLFNSIINLVLISIVNYINAKINEISLW
ncbi:MAG: sugar ABC transporter permease [Clostridiaceae bacterium]|nr:sugar ABC transporter permease [Clostridiaceae bacterium]